MEYKNVKEIKFNITLNFYENIVYIKSLSNEFRDVVIKMYDSKNEVHCTFNSSFTENLKIWYKMGEISFSDIRDLNVEILHNNIIIKKEYFKFKTKYNILITVL